MTDNIRKKEKKSRRVLCAFLAALFCAVCLTAAGSRPALADDADPTEVQAADTSSQDEIHPEEKPQAEEKPTEKPKAEEKPIEKPQAEEKPTEKQEPEAKPNGKPQAEEKAAEEPKEQKTEEKPAENPQAKDEKAPEKQEADPSDARKEEKPESAPQEESGAADPAGETEVPPADQPESAENPADHPDPDAETGDKPAEEPGGASGETPGAAEETGSEESGPAEEISGGDPVNADESSEKDSGETGEAQETEQSFDGTLTVGENCEIKLERGMLYQLTVGRRSDLTLTVSGLRVSVTVTSLDTGAASAWESASSGIPGQYVIHAPVTLDRGSYQVAVDPIPETAWGDVSLCFAPREEVSPAEKADPSKPEETASGESGPDPENPEASGDAPAEETESDPSSETPSENLEATEASLTEEAPAGETAEILPEGSEDTAEPEQPAEAETAESEPLTVRVTFSCDGELQPGAAVTLTAVVSDASYQGRVRWQYSADGGQTVCDVEGSEGTEYTYLLSEENRNYWWRAILE